jgi:YVTN family beta-propeller protein
VNGFRGATGVAGRTPGVDGDIIYVGSRSEDRIQTFTVGRPVNNAPPYLLPSDFFFLDAVGSNTGGSTDTRGMQFSPAGDRLYVVNRRPPSLQIFDTSLDESGFPRNVASGASDICRQASTVTAFGAGAVAGDGERAYVTCFQDGQVYVVDPRGQSQVEDIITVGRGPYAVVGATLSESPALSVVFVSNFLEDTIAVVDVTPTSANRNRVVLRIGTPRAP